MSVAPPVAPVASGAAGSTAPAFVRARGAPAPCPCRCVALATLTAAPSSGGGRHPEPRPPSASLRARRQAASRGYSARSRDRRNHLPVAALLWPRQKPHPPPEEDAIRRRAFFPLACAPIAEQSCWAILLACATNATTFPPHIVFRAAAGAPPPRSFPATPPPAAPPRGTRTWPPLSLALCRVRRCPGTNCLLFFHRASLCTVAARRLSVLSGIVRGPGLARTDARTMILLHWLRYG